MALPSEVPVAPVQKRLQETYNKLLLEEAQLGEEATQMLPVAPSSQMVLYIHIKHGHPIYIWKLYWLE